MINSHEVTVIGQNLRYNSSDTFLCLPVTNLCLIEYVYYGISVHRAELSAGVSSRTSSILVVGTENDTVIKLIATQPVSFYVNESPTNINNSPVNLTAGMQYSCDIKIDRLDTVYIRSFYDLTGIKIVTNKPVFVLSGHRCGRMPPDVPSCDLLIEQVPPTTLWGTEYYTAPLATRRSYTIKILAAYNSTVVDIYCNNTRESYNISEGKYMKKTLSVQEYCAINSTRPVLVAQFSHGQEDDTTGNGDPMMTLVPATNQYNNKFQFSTLKSQLDFTHHINIIVLAEYYQPELIYLISGGVNRSLNMHQWTPIMFNNVTEAYGLQMNISEGVSEVFHGNTSALMTTSVYGFAGYNAYGHPGGCNTIKACAEIIVELFDQLENENNSASFTCQATGEPIPNISWYFNDVMINVSDTSKYRIESKIATIEDTLEVFNVTSSDVGSYICMATNELGNDSSIGILTVNSAAELVKLLHIQEGLNITLTCSGAGHPPPQVEWRKVDGTFSNRTTLSNSSMSTNEGNVTRVTVELIITGAYRCDNGIYECSVSNLLNTVTNTVNLSVLLDFSGCCAEKDATWRIRWPSTMKGKTEIQSCPGGAESVGNASRLCDNKANWQEPNMDNCSTIEITRIMEEVNNLTPDSVEPEAVVALTGRLTNITTMERAIFPSDLQNTLTTLETFLSIADEAPSAFNATALENLVSIVDNIIDLRNNASFNALESRNMEEDDDKPNNSTGAQVLQLITRQSSLLGSTLKLSNNESADITIVGNNIVMNAQLLSQADINNGTGITFPMEGSDLESVLASSKVPTAAIISEEDPVLVINTYLADPFYLPDDFDGVGEFSLSSPVLMVQLSSNNSSNTKFSEDDYLLLNFTIFEKSKLPRCVFWQPERELWSDEGLTTTKDNSSNLTKCQSSHLTSFAVLVDTQGASTSSTGEAKVLSIVSYIGCGISILSLLLTIVAMLFWRKSVYQGVHNFNHFNLALSLMIGLIIFTSSIETATDNEVACAVVAGLLHYFFLAAFTWMLCEGIYLFVHLNFIFYSGFFTKWYFFVGLGYGLPIPIVAISAGVAHDYYGTDRTCWLSEKKGTIWTFVAPMLLIIAVNLIFLFKSMIIVYGSKRNSPQQSTHIQTAKSMVIAAIVLLPLLGSTWVIGLFAVNEDTTIFACIFAVLNSLQGFFIFIFYVLRQDKVRTSTSSKLRSFASRVLSTLQKGRMSFVEYSDTTNLKTAKTGQCTNDNPSHYASHDAHHGNISSSPKTPTVNVTENTGISNPLYTEVSRKTIVNTPGTLDAVDEEDSDTVIYSTVQ
ncbi:adhesion G protein-coupled receptor L3-like [Dysidea avara]|uniref:adhesion G protein-coupled receptor L3-like n=1 Tax=Dysidea avara TaxID=196820 RepID=UPI00331D369E